MLELAGIIFLSEARTINGNLCNAACFHKADLSAQMEGSSSAPSAKIKALTAGLPTRCTTL